MSSPHILVVDDEPEIRNTVKDILEDEGYSVSVAENAQSARECRIEQTPDLVFLDIWMPIWSFWISGCLRKMASVYSRTGKKMKA